MSLISLPQQGWEWVKAHPQLSIGIVYGIGVLVVLCRSLRAWWHEDAEEASSGYREGLDEVGVYRRMKDIARGKFGSRVRTLFFQAAFWPVTFTIWFVKMFLFVVFFPAIYVASKAKEDAVKTALARRQGLICDYCHTLVPSTRLQHFCRTGSRDRTLRCDSCGDDVPVNERRHVCQDDPQDASLR